MNRTRAACLAALVSIALAACGGSSATPAGQTSAPGASVAPTEAATTPAESAAPSTPAEESPSGGTVDLGGAASALADVDSYRMHLVMSGSGEGASMVSMMGNAIVMDITVVEAPVRAADMAMRLGEGSDAMVTGYRIIGDKAWISLGGESWMTTPADDAETTLDSFAPEKMMASYAEVSGLHQVGDETKNGVAAVHYEAPSEVIAEQLAALGMVGATWDMDVWLARDGGYLVAAAIEGVAAAGADAGTFTMTVDVTNVNDPANEVTEPENVTDFGG